MSEETEQIEQETEAEFVNRRYAEVIEQDGSQLPANDEAGSQLTEAENPLEGENVIAPGVAAQKEAHGKIQAQVERCRRAFARSLHSYFEVGKEIIKLRELMTETNGKRPGRAELAGRLGLPISEERVSQIVLTTEKFLRHAKKNIDFKVYEVARLLDDKSILKRDDDELAQLVTANPSTSKIKKAMEATEALVTVAVRRDNNGIFRVGEKLAEKHDSVSHGLAMLVAISRLGELAERELKGNLWGVGSNINSVDENYRQAVLYRLMEMAKREGDERSMEAFHDYLEMETSGQAADESSTAVE
jgi:hypothetical protein